MNKSPTKPNSEPITIPITVTVEGVEWETDVFFSGKVESGLDSGVGVFIIVLKVVSAIVVVRIVESRAMVRVRKTEVGMVMGDVIGGVISDNGGDVAVAATSEETLGDQSEDSSGVTKSVEQVVGLLVLHEHEISIVTTMVTPSRLCFLSLLSMISISFSIIHGQ